MWNNRGFMYWGLKSRFHDIDDVLTTFPQSKSVELHLTDKDVEEGNLNGKVYNCDYSIHLPEYWNQVMINPCDLDNLKHNLSVYIQCIEKGLKLQNNFNANGKLKVIMHPGGMTIDPISDEIHPIKFYKDSLYKRLNSFLSYLEMLPQFKDKIEILVENMPPLPWFYGGQYYSNIFCDPLEIKNWCWNTGRNMCLDVSHLGLFCNYVDCSLVEAIKDVMFHVKQIHLADAKGTDGEGAPIGDGNINFVYVMEIIKNMECSVIPETMWGHLDNYKEFKRVIEECNKWVI